MSVRVLTIPATHPYLERTRPQDSRFRMLPEPDVNIGDGAWRPSAALNPDWVGRHADEIDIIHVHFGFESRSAAQLQEWVQALRDGGISLVQTVHDLDNPHLRDQRRHRAALDVLVPAADALLTLTPGAAAQIAATWQRQALVVPHPHLAPIEEVGGARPAPARPARVGVHLKSLRPNCGSTSLVAALAEACDAADAQLVVHTHDGLDDPSFERYDAELAATLRTVQEAGVEVHRVGRMSDADLTRYLRSLTVSVLPHRWGTHSGWIELCRDLGTAVLAPRIGHLPDQHPHGLYDWSGEAPDPGSLRCGLADALAADAGTVRRAGRDRERHEVCRAVARTYADVAARCAR